MSKKLYFITIPYKFEIKEAVEHANTKKEQIEYISRCLRWHDGLKSYFYQNYRTGSFAQSAIRLIEQNQAYLRGMFDMTQITK